MTNENKHTPAPWFNTQFKGKYRRITENKFGGGKIIARQIESDANAHLIAAAPLLLKEMEDLAKALEDVQKLPQSFYNAIAQARGRNVQYT